MTDDPQDTAELMAEILAAAAELTAAHEKNARNFRAIAAILAGPFGAEIAAESIVPTPEGDTLDALDRHAAGLEALAAAVRNVRALIAYYAGR